MARKPKELKRITSKSALKRFLNAEGKLVTKGEGSKVGRDIELSLYEGYYGPDNDWAEPKVLKSCIVCSQLLDKVIREFRAKRKEKGCQTKRAA